MTNAAVAKINLKDAKHDFIFGVIYLAGFVLALEIILVPIFALLGGRGAEESSNLAKFYFYVAWGVGVILVMVLFKLIRLYMKGDDVYDMHVHDPEKGVFARMKNLPFFRFFYKVNKSFLLLLLFSLIIFVPVGFVGGFIKQTAFEGSFWANVFPQTSFPGTNFYTEQQVTETADFSLAVWPASPVETISDALIICLMLIAIRYLVIKGIIPSALGTFLKWTIVPVLGALAHLAIHVFRYGGSDVSLLGVFNFGLLTSLLYLFFASLVIILVLHDINNALLKLFDMGILGSDASIAVMLIIEATLVALFIWSYTSKSKKEHMRSVASPGGI